MCVCLKKKFCTLIHVFNLWKMLTSHKHSVLLHFSLKVCMSCGLCIHVCMSVEHVRRSASLPHIQRKGCRQFLSPGVTFIAYFSKFCLSAMPGASSTIIGLTSELSPHFHSTFCSNQGPEVMKSFLGECMYVYVCEALQVGMLFRKIKTHELKLCGGCEQKHLSVRRVLSLCVFGG